MSIDAKLFGTDLFGEPMVSRSNGVLREKFIIPPFSVLNAREGIWQERKQKWLELGIKSEIGRGETAGKKLTMSETIQRLKPSADQALKNSRICPGGSARPVCDYSKRERGDGVGRPMGAFGALKNLSGDQVFPNDGQTGTSIFDPVLCELICRWWCKPAGQVVDPFCGGSVRGIVAAMLGLKYWGCDLRQEQVDANIEQGMFITPSNLPRWVVGDALSLLESSPRADLIFSCPPYGDLERYSDDLHDLSTMAWGDFKAAYADIIYKAVGGLRENRFACFVVGDFRDDKGFYRNFVGETIAAFIKAGAGLYNEAIFVTSVGSLPIRISGQFNNSRKLGKTHQNVLVFCKGNPETAALQCQ